MLFFGLDRCKKKKEKGKSQIDRIESVDNQSFSTFLDSTKVQSQLPELQN